MVVRGTADSASAGAVGSPGMTASLGTESLGTGPPFVVARAGNINSGEHQ